MYRTYRLQWQLIKTISYCKFAIVFILLEISRSFNFYEDFFQVVSLGWRSFSSGLSSDSWTATKVSLSSSAVEPSTISSGLHGNWFFLPLALPILPQGWRPPCFLLASLYERRNKSLMKYKKIFEKQPKSAVEVCYCGIPTQWFLSFYVPNYLFVFLYSHFSHCFRILFIRGDLYSVRFFRLILLCLISFVKVYQKKI